MKCSTNLKLVNMKTKRLVLLFCIIGFTFSSCQDGDLGISKFRFLNSAGFGYNIYFGDPNLPATIYENTFYQTKAGTYNYSFDYGASFYYGTYTIVQEEGEEWNGIGMGILTTPANGDFRLYTFDLDAPVGEELSYTKNHKDIIIDKTIYFNGGRLIIKGKCVYDPKHILNKQKSNVTIKK